MPYVHFWHTYISSHRHAGASHRWSFDPFAVLIVLLCGVLLVGWMAVQQGSRCETCGRWPVACRCARAAGWLRRRR